MINTAKLFLKSSLLLIAIMLSSACSSGKFDCPVGEGIFCKPVSEVDRMADRGSFSKENRKQTKGQKKRFFKKKHGSLKEKNIKLLKADLNPPERIPDQVLQVWVAPFETADGVYHQPARMNVVVKKGHWGDRPFKYEETS